MSGEAKCANCQFFQADDPPYRDHECHRYPQTVYINPTHWCGEFKRKAAAK